MVVRSRRVSTAMSRTRLLKNGAVGLAAMIVVGLVPVLNVLAPVVGGGVAGSLQREDARGGAVAGAVVGLLWTLLTLVLVTVVVVWASLTPGPGAGPFDWLPAAGGAAWIVLLFVVTNAFVVVLTTVGGLVGGVLARDSEGESEHGREERSPPHQPGL